MKTRIQEIVYRICSIPRVFIFRLKIWLSGLQERYLESYFSKELNFLLHRYGIQYYSPAHAKKNVQLILQLEKEDWIDATEEGELLKVSPGGSKALFRFKNFLLLGAPESRARKVLYFTLLTLTIEIYNPFDKQTLKIYLERKIHFIERLLKKIPKINGKPWYPEVVRLHVELFRKSSIFQHQIITWMHRAVQKQKEPQIVKEAKSAIKKGLHPILITTGYSGSYWMRNSQREIIGLFKPFDEELMAPNNPMGPGMQGALGLRRARRGIRVGEAAHREVAAYLVDQFFGFGIVPRTYYASFSHQVFFSAKEKRFIKQEIKTKYGSFQEYIEGFTALEKISREERELIPLEEFQLLIVLDLIIGNLDRNTNNVLIGENKIAAIDHGLTFPDLHDKLSFWYWRYLEQGKKPLFGPFVELLQSFPFEKLGWKLRKHCQISTRCLEKMRERIVLFTQGILAGYTPSDLAYLMVRDNLLQLEGLDSTLEQKAKEIVSLYDPSIVPEEYKQI